MSSSVWNFCSCSQMSFRGKTNGCVPKCHLFTQAGKVIQIKFLLETATQSDLQDMKNKPCSIVYLVILLQTLYLRTYHLQI